MSREQERKSIGRSAGKIGAATFLSHIFGMVRDILFASLFGTSLFADAFNLSFSIPTFLRRVFGEGVMNAAFIPVFTKHRMEKGPREASRFASNALLSLTLILAVSVVAAEFLAPWIVRIYAQGWQGDEVRIETAVRLARILFPYVFFAGLAVLVMGMLNAVKHFTVPALSPVVFNIAIIAAAVGAYRLGPAGFGRIDLFCAGVVVGAAGQFLVQLPMLPRRGLQFIPNLNWRSEELRAVGRLMIPGIIGIGVVQVNSVADTVFATFLSEGSVTALRLGHRVMLLPLAIFATAVASASLPSLSAQVVTGGTGEAKRTLAFSLRFLFFFLVPSTVGLLVLASPVIRLLFVRGAFDADRSLSMTASTLFFYAIGLLAYGGLKGLTQFFFSHRDTRTPVVVGAIAMVSNVIFNFLLYRPLQAAGLALATTLAGVINFGLLYALLVKRYGGLGEAVLLPAVRVAASAVIMGGAVYWVSSWLAPGEGARLPAQLVHVAVSIAAGAAVYLGAAAVIAPHELRETAGALAPRLRRR